MSEENSNQLVRQALAEKVFAVYHELIHQLRILPIQQGLPFVQKAYLDIDTGMVIVKEMIMTGQLIFPQPKTTPESKL